MLHALNSFTQFLCEGNRLCQGCFTTVEMRGVDLQDTFSQPGSLACGSLGGLEACPRWSRTDRKPASGHMGRKPMLLCTGWKSVLCRCREEVTLPVYPEVSLLEVPKPDNSSRLPYVPQF